MHKYRFLLVACLLMAGCASVNPYNVSEGEGAYLKNRSEYKGKSYFLYEFRTAVTLQERKSFEPDAATARDDAIYNIPSGHITLGGKILYYPKGGPVSSVGEAFGVSSKFIFWFSSTSCG